MHDPGTNSQSKNELETVSYTQVLKPISHLSAQGSACPAQLQPQTAGFLPGSHYTERVSMSVCVCCWMPRNEKVLNQTEPQLREWACLWGLRVCEGGWDLTSRAVLLHRGMDKERERERKKIEKRKQKRGREKKGGVDADTLSLKCILYLLSNLLC